MRKKETTEEIHAKGRKRRKIGKEQMVHLFFTAVNTALTIILAYCCNAANTKGVRSL
jgi:hypothetical protein